MHPQHWPEDLDYTGQKVVVIGSGATAVTLVPAMAAEAGHVTMLQRSPTYVLSLPADDPVAQRLSKLPEQVAYPIVRWKSILLAMASYWLSRRRPDVLRGLIRKATARQLRPHRRRHPLRRRTTPGTSGCASCPTATCSRRCAAGPRRSSPTPSRPSPSTGSGWGRATSLEADVVVTATGLNLKPFGGIELSVDGAPVKLPETMAYKALMLSGVPNFAFTIGYTNAPDKPRTTSSRSTSAACCGTSTHGHRSVVLVASRDRRAVHGLHLWLRPRSLGTCP